MSKPFFSVVIPCYNSATSLKKTLESIFNQKTVAQYEVIVVDNNSQDAPSNVTRDHETCVLITSTRQGAGAARNTGAATAKGNYLIFVDADVTLPPHWIEDLYQLYLTHPWVELVAGTVRPAVMKNKLLHKLRTKLLNEKTSGTNNFLSLNPFVSTPLINTSLCSMSRAKFSKLEGFNPELLRHEDWDLTERALSYSMHMKSLATEGEVYFESDSFWQYFRRSSQLGFWFPIHEALLARRKMPHPLPMILPKVGVTDPALELLRIINSVFFVAGYTLGSFQARSIKQTPPPRIGNPKNPFLFNFSLNSQNYSLDPFIAIVHHPKGINLYHGVNFLSLTSEESQVFLKCFGGLGQFDDREKALLQNWVEKKIFFQPQALSK